MMKEQHNLPTTLTPFKAFSQILFLFLKKIGFFAAVYDENGGLAQLV